ncbi:MAG: flotillin [Chlamydiae bacterium CG10_big_fil_rev_8_21_14_0_10_42_34]|nr:MAG: flotillin [Chlamydiae bacterium CG10_big_fil_rev_8_21_14_0_10_42_34]
MDFEISFLTASVVSFLLFVFSTVYFLAKLYRRCPSNKILVVYGRVGGSRTVQCYHGGGTFVWPLIQGCAFLDLTPRTIHIPLKGALSHQNIRVNVPSTFTVAVGLTPDVMNNAAVRMLDLDHRGIESMATEIIIGQLRLTVAGLRIEEINQDRERFLESIKKNIEPELHKIGLTLLNVNITDITDESEYIESIGKKASATAVNQAKIDVAEQEKQGDIGKALAERDRRISVAAYNAAAVKGENESKAEMALTNATLAEKEAQASQRSQVAAQQAETEIQRARALAQAQLLQTEQIIPEEIRKKKVEIEAAAEAQCRVLNARGEAEAILAIKQAEAEGIQKLLDAKAKGYKQLVEACGSDAKSASTMLLIEKLEEIVKLQTEAIKNIKIDKITVWDSGNNTGDPSKGGTTSNFISQFVKSLPSLHDVTAMAGLELPPYLGKVTANVEEPVLRK